MIMLKKLQDDLSTILTGWIHCIPMMNSTEEMLCKNFQNVIIIICHPNFWHYNNQDNRPLCAR